MEYAASRCTLTIDGIPMNTVTSERVLVARCKAGDHSAFVELIGRSSPAALRAIHKITRNSADADDVMQDTVVNAFNGLPSFDQRSTFSTWLTRIAINNALLLLRRRKHNKEISFEESDDSPLQVADHRISPEQMLIRNQSIEVVRRAIQAMPSALRDYVEQRYLQELPHSEAASSLGISLSAGKSRSLRARQRLQCLLVSRRSRSTLKLHVTKHASTGTASAATNVVDSAATSCQ
jgi:RNA polymerase sigma-70 factor (ECF subfamily)